MLCRFSNAQHFATKYRCKNSSMAVTKSPSWLPCQLHFSTQLLVKLLEISSVMTMGTNHWWKDSRILPTSCFLSGREGQNKERKSEEKQYHSSFSASTFLIEDAFTATGILLILPKIGLKMTNNLRCVIRWVLHYNVLIMRRFWKDCCSHPGLIVSIRTSYAPVKLSTILLHSSIHVFANYWLTLSTLPLSYHSASLCHY